jgi:phosphoribosylaminoimidazole-succinocarboxamide synthase
MNLIDVNYSELRRVGTPYSGKANDVWQTNDPRVLEITSTDRASAGNGAKRAVIPCKGKANNLISTEVFKRLEAADISTHYLADGSDEQSKYVVKAEPIKLEVIGRFFTAGSFCREYKLPKDIPFDGVFVEFTYKNDAEGDPRITDREIVRAGLVRDAEDVALMREVTERVAFVLRDFFDEVGAQLIDFKIEFGYSPSGNIIVIDEVSGDTVRARDKKTGESLDKDRFRQDLENVSLGYSTLEARLEAKN